MGLDNDMCYSCGSQYQALCIYMSVNVYVYTCMHVCVYDIVYVYYCGCQSGVKVHKVHFDSGNF